MSAEDDYSPQTFGEMVSDVRTLGREMRDLKGVIWKLVIGFMFLLLETTFALVFLVLKMQTP